MTVPTVSRRARWAVPAGAVAVVAAVATASAITVAQAAPALPARTPAQLLAGLATRTPPPLTGTVVETASLGIPQLPSAGSPTSLTSLLAGSHTLRVWYGGTEQVRLAVPVPMGETDVIRNGSTAWLWQSSGNTVSKFLIPSRLRPERAPVPGRLPLTPEQAARQVLAAVGPTTRVTSETNVTVAGQPAYQLVVAPRDSRSLIGRITIALDGQHPGVPLRLQVFARGAHAPSFQVGYTSISFVRPAAANFAFTPPAGATVHTVIAPGTGWVGQASPPQLSRPARFAPRVLGEGWLTVVELPATALSGLANGNAASAAGQAARSVSGQGSGVGNAALLAALLKGASPVHGTWGSGRLLRTSLVSVLITSSGHLLFGAVTPQVLYAAAAQAP